MARKPIIAGNWKMNKTHTEAISLVRILSYELREPDYDRVEVVVCPPFTSLRPIQLVLEDEHLPMGLGAQNLHPEPEGAFTGEISGAFLKALHCSYVIVGHSERRKHFGETDEVVRDKVEAAYREGLTPILCVGESLEQREAGEAEGVVRRQVTTALGGLSADDLAKVVVAYEPIWAIGTGRSATPEDANSTIGAVRKALAEAGSEEIADGIRIQYGGSVSPGNIAQFMEQPEIDGALVGGASLDPKSFAMVIKY